MRDEDCTFCEQFDFRSNEPDFSEYTPGRDARIGCWEGLWELKDPWSPKQFRLNVLQGKICKHFKRTED